MATRTPEDALDALIEDEAQEAAPVLDWQRVEDRLFEKIEAESAPRYELRKSFYAGRWVAVAALAATVVLGVAVRRHVPSSPAPAAVAGESKHEAPRAIDGDRLEIGKPLHAHAGEVVVAHTSRASWTLGPGSTAHVKQGGEHLVIVLEEGTVLAEVTPSTTPERFAVEAGNVRVTVHGTIFRVTRTDDGVSVDVLRGTVSVRPVDGGARDEQRLVAPASAHFRGDGHPSEPSSLQASHVTETAEAAQKAIVSRKSTAKPQPSPGTAPREARAAIAPLIETVRRCFTERTEARGDMRVSLQTSVAVQALPDGKIAAAVFQPPLAPVVEQCVAERLAGMRLAPSKDGFQIEQPITLER